MQQGSIALRFNDGIRNDRSSGPLLIVAFPESATSRHNFSPSASPLGLLLMVLPLLAPKRKSLARRNKTGTGMLPSNNPAGDFDYPGYEPPACVLAGGPLILFRGSFVRRCRAPLSAGKHTAPGLCSARGP